MDMLIDHHQGNFNAVFNFTVLREIPVLFELLKDCDVFFVIDHNKLIIF